VRAVKALAAAGVLALAAAPSALADKPADPNCWGEASADFAQTAPGALGEHASSPPPIDLTPHDRDGLGSGMSLVRLVATIQATPRRSWAPTAGR
jgi:hypothetical protein